MSASSIASLLLYFAGLLPLREGVLVLLPAASVALVGLYLWARRVGKADLIDRMKAGLWAGAIATFAYDVVRVPIARSGTPVFKAISYFGTVILNQPSPTLASELVGWTYHLSNGIGFGLMYAVMVRKPRWWTAVAWGLLLEGVMLLTPYVEVFGYRLTKGFLAITLGAHVVYGLALWVALSYWTRGELFGSATRLSKKVVTVSFLVACLGIAAIALDFHARHARAIPTSPPGNLGPHLFTTWDVLEPDRVAAMWAYRRFVDPQARFHFVPPFSRIVHGKPFDTPESEVRRTGGRSATEVLLTKHGKENDAKLALLGRMTHLCEITPWMLPSDRPAQRLAQDLRELAGNAPSEVSVRADEIFRHLDKWYATSAP